MNKFGVRSKYSERVAIMAMEGESRTQQHFKDQVNINNILAKYRKTGIIEHVQRAKERYGDFTELGEYAKNLDKVAKAQQAFEMLPAELRNQFKNSIPGFFEFIGKPENKEQCIKWGIFEKDTAVNEIEVPVGSKKDGAMKKAPVSKEAPETKE